MYSGFAGATQRFHPHRANLAFHRRRGYQQHRTLRYEYVYVYHTIYIYTHIHTHTYTHTY